MSHPDLIIVLKQTQPTLPCPHCHGTGQVPVTLTRQG